MSLAGGKIAVCLEVSRFSLATHVAHMIVGRLQFPSHFQIRRRRDTNLDGRATRSSSCHRCDSFSHRYDCKSTKRSVEVLEERVSKRYTMVSALNGTPTFQDI